MRRSPGSIRLGCTEGPVALAQENNNPAFAIGGDDVSWLLSKLTTATSAKPSPLRSPAAKPFGYRTGLCEVMALAKETRGCGPGAAAVWAGFPAKRADARISRATIRVIRFMTPPLEIDSGAGSGRGSPDARGACVAKVSTV